MAETSAKSRNFAFHVPMRDYHEEVSAIRQSVAGTHPEMFGRFVFPALGIGMVAALLTDVTVVILYLIYALAQVMQFGFIFTRTSPATRGDYVLSLFFCAFSSVSFVVIAGYMWSTEVLLAQYAATFLILGFAIYGLTRSRSVFALMLIDGVPIAVAALFSVWYIGQRLAEQVPLVVPMAMTLLIVGYYLFSVYDVFVTRNQLQQAKDSAVSAERLEAVGRLTGGVAHDFNNILTAVLGQLDLYGHLGNATEKDECVAAAHQAAQRAARLTAQLLFFARKARLTAEPTDLAAWIATFAVRARDILPDTIELRTVLARSLPEVTVDRDHLETVLLQLVMNACDGMQRAGMLTIAVDPVVVTKRRRMHGGTELAPRSYCAIRVEDTGTGIDPEALTRIFEPFFTTKAKGQASGLGLPMAAGFAEQSGGAVAVSSQPGIGTSVELFLPVSDRQV